MVVRKKKKEKTKRKTDRKKKGRKFCEFREGTV